MKYIQLPLITLLVLFILFGCGQKGPLYLPQADKVNLKNNIKSN
ncbi:LPS translocon maturation chaperone LptM [Legionella sp.]